MASAPNSDSQTSTPRLPANINNIIKKRTLDPTVLINSNGIEETFKMLGTEKLNKHEQNFINQLKAKDSTFISINPEYRKTIVELNGKEEVHFQCIIDGKWSPCDALSNPLPSYGKESRVFIKYTPAPPMGNSTKRFTSKGGRTKKTMTKTQKKRVRVCFSKKGKKTHCKYMKISLPKRR